MYYRDYSWTAYSGDDPKVSGEPDNSLLSRREGYEMLYFINKCGQLWNWPASDPIPHRKLERLIREHVPSNYHSQANVKQWIEANWKLYWDSLAV
jgi:hypothetical protein